MTPEAGQDAAARSRRAYGLALVTLATGGLLVVFGYGRTWLTADVPLVAGAEGTERLPQYTGGALFPLAAACGWLALAGLVGVVATRQSGRRLVAVVLVAAGLTAAAAAVAFAADPAGRLGTVSGPGVATVVVAVESTPWWTVALAGALAVLAAAVWTIARGGGWPTMGARYDRSPRADISPWEAMDKGQDPTDDLVE